MSSLGVELPLRLSSIDGFVMIKSFKRLIRQNLKMLILTNPGERVMEPNYGVGIKTYLFSQFEPSTYARIQTKIKDQARTYMPAVKITDVLFEVLDPDTSSLGIAIKYSIPDIGIKDLLEFTI